MNGGPRIVDFRGPAAQDALLAEEPAALTLSDYDMIEDEDAPTSRFWVLPTLGVLLGAAWIGGALWFTWPSLATLPPIALAEFVGALCVPLALIAVLLLLGLRTSRAEAHRFGATAAAMRREATRLETRVAALTAALDGNRAQLAEQAESIGALGDAANAKLATVGLDMADQIAAAGSHAAALTDAAGNAHARLGVLLALLPKALEESRAMTERLESAGIVASEHTAALDGQLVALGERGREAEAVAGGAAQKLAAHLARMEATSETAGARLESVTGEMSHAVDALLGRTATAIDEARKGVTAQGEAMLAMLGTNQAALEATARDSAESLATRITAIEAVIDRIAARLDTQREAGDAMIGALDTGLAQVSDRIATLHSEGTERTQMLAASISALGSSADAMAESIRTGDRLATMTIASAERLLTALDAATREIDETVPEAIARLDTRIAASRQVVVDAKPELLALVTAAESTHDAIEAIAQVIATQRDTANKLSVNLLDTLSSSREKADALGIMVDETIGRTHRFAEEAAPRLVEALLRVRDTASAAAERARETLSRVIPEAAALLEAESGAAMQRAAEGSVNARIAEIGTAADKAVEAAARASERLTRQMLTIADSTAMVEARIEDAREERERADQDSFARRMSLLVEALNSAAIDIAKAFSADVSDSAWAAYLKGDRGVFTRRAVRLLDASDAKEIARLYDEDSHFREQVNRYIHDFEAMLRGILAQRDGSPLGVTMLSSDMGKLYVAMAQAIERLR